MHIIGIDVLLNDFAMLCLLLVQQSPAYSTIV